MIFTLIFSFNKNSIFFYSFFVIGIIGQFYALLFPELFQYEILPKNDILLATYFSTKRIALMLIYSWTFLAIKSGYLSKK